MHQRGLTAMVFLAATALLIVFWVLGQVVFPGKDDVENSIGDMRDGGFQTIEDAKNAKSMIERRWDEGIRQ